MNGNLLECPRQLLLSDFLSSILSTSSLPTWLLPLHPSYLGTLILSQRHFNGFLSQTEWVPEGQIASLMQSAHWRPADADVAGPAAALRRRRRRRDWHRSSSDLSALDGIGGIQSAMWSGEARAKLLTK